MAVRAAAGHAFRPSRLAAHRGGQLRDCLRLRPRPLRAVANRCDRRDRQTASLGHRLKRQALASHEAADGLRQGQRCLVVGLHVKDVIDHARHSDPRLFRFAAVATRTPPDHRHARAVVLPLRRQQQQRGERLQNANQLIELIRLQDLVGLSREIVGERLHALPGGATAFSQPAVVSDQAALP